MDSRPLNCRFRLRDEGKAYPRSSCEACGRTITTGLGSTCHKDDFGLEKATPAYWLDESGRKVMHNQDFFDFPETSIDLTPVYTGCAK